VTGAIDLKLGGIEDDIEQRMQEVRDNKFIPEEQKNATLAALQALDDLVEVIRVVSQTSYTFNIKSVTDHSCLLSWIIELIYNNMLLI
jgi:predicted  nucleic acid-binding Zn-ribbon protein